MGACHSKGSATYSTKGRDNSVGMSGGIDQNRLTDTQKKAIDRLITQVKGKGDTFTTPVFNLDNDGNIEFEYKGTETRKREKGGKMQSETKGDIVEVTTRYYGVIRTSGNKMRIERRSETESEKVIKRGRL